MANILRKILRGSSFENRVEVNELEYCPGASRHCRRNERHTVGPESKNGAARIFRMPGKHKPPKNDGAQEKHGLQIPDWIDPRFPGLQPGKTSQGAYDCGQGRPPENLRLGQRAHLERLKLPLRAFARLVNVVGLFSCRSWSDARHPAIS